MSKTLSLFSEQVQHLTWPPLGLSHQKDSLSLPYTLPMSCCLCTSSQAGVLNSTGSSFQFTDPLLLTLVLGPILVFHNFLKLDD